MELYSVLVTGANRGIGLEFVRQLSRLPKAPHFIFATYRSSESLEALTEIRNSSTSCQIVLIKMDVQKLEDVTTTRKVIEQAVGENGLTLLINNAGVLQSLEFPNITEENLLKHFTVNTIGPITVFQEMLPLLQKAASRGDSLGGMNVSRCAVFNISSMGGCFAKIRVEFSQGLIFPGYKISKAALNMAMRVISAVVKDQGILVVSICPGWVKTDMGSDRAELTVEESISSMLQTLEKLNDSHHGTFMDRCGNISPF